MIQNLHTHTVRCRHASGSDEEYVCAAVQAGFRTLGFSDHTPMPFSGGYYSTMRMYPGQLEDYIQSMCSLRERYDGKLDIRIGLEAEYYPGLFSELTELLRAQPLDYLILGQHYVYDEIGSPYMGRPTDDPAVLNAYVEQTVAGMKTGLFTCLAHPDLIDFTGSRTLYERQMRRLCQCAQDTHTPLELNINGAFLRRNYPNPLFWEIAAQYDVLCVLGCDAHSPQALMRDEAEQACRALAARCALHLCEQIPLIKPKL